MDGPEEGDGVGEGEEADDAARGRAHAPQNGAASAGLLAPLYPWKTESATSCWWRTPQPLNLALERPVAPPTAYRRSLWTPYVYDESSVDEESGVRMPRTDVCGGSVGEAAGGAQGGEEEVSKQGEACCAPAGSISSAGEAKGRPAPQPALRVVVIVVLAGWLGRQQREEGRRRTVKPILMLGLSPTRKFPLTAVGRAPVLLTVGVPTVTEARPRELSSRVTELAQAYDQRTGWVRLRGRRRGRNKERGERGRVIEKAWW